MGRLRGDWRDLFAGFVIALDVRKLVLALTGALLIFMFVFLPAPWVALKYDTELAAELDARGAEWYVAMVPDAIGVIYRQPWHIPFWWTCAAILIGTAIWSLFGGAISRIAAVEIAKEDRIRTQEALSFAWRKWGSNFSSLVACVLGFLFFSSLIAVVALPGRIPGAGPWLGLLPALLMPALFVLSFIASLNALGTAFGFPLFYPAIAAEGTDAFDAISRGFSYIYSRPWHALAYTTVMLVHGAISAAFINAFGLGMLAVTCLPLRVGMGPNFDRVLDFALGQASYDNLVAAGGTGLGWSAILITSWLYLLAGLTLAYALSYLQSQLTMIYFLLRQRVDELPMTYVYEEREEEESAAAGGEKPAEAAKDGGAK
ncbi:MAG: hypothetical protein FD180_4226 [Planctomycetota bacterium]|nr:MAG: hypothetical protein FD180_4226 [Planctomycetota bacterium]